jgi:hypothetical protein
MYISFVALVAGLKEYQTSSSELPRQLVEADKDCVAPPRFFVVSGVEQNCNSGLAPAHSSFAGGGGVYTQTDSVV